MQVAGSGLQRARALAPDQGTLDDIDLFATQHPDPANIGSTPPFYEANNINSYGDCLKLVFFYNENMGIRVGDGLLVWTKAIKEWLT